MNESHRLNRKEREVCSRNSNCLRSAIPAGARSKSLEHPILKRLPLSVRHTSMGFESMQKQSSLPSITFAIRLRISSHKAQTNFRLSLNCPRDIILGINPM